MRLLRTEDGSTFSLVEVFTDIPPYAILSHTWGPDEDEVTFKEILKGKNTRKPGYSKLNFCAAQATKDKLQYFWVDTCCINKSSSTELSEAINSMFSWYKRAAICYVLLSDVSSQGDTTEAFRRSRWFTRGWTLQKILAPTSLQFFSAEGDLLGDRTSLLQDINEVTGIPTSALQGAAMAQFSVDERLAWAARRHTKREEDAAYPLLGLYDVHMPLIYGEGRRKAFARLRKEIESSGDGGPQTDLLYSFVRDHWPQHPSTTARHVHREHYIRHIVDAMRTLQAVVLITGAMGSLTTFNTVPTTMFTFTAPIISFTFIFFASVGLIMNTGVIQRYVVTVMYALVLVIFARDVLQRRGLNV